MNIVKIIKNLKFLRVLMKKHLADENLQFEIRHDPKNVIDLEATTEESVAEKSANSDAEKMIQAHEGGPSAMEALQNEFNNDIELVNKEAEVSVEPLIKAKPPAHLPPIDASALSGGGKSNSIAPAENIDVTPVPDPSQDPEA